MNFNLKQIIKNYIQNIKNKRLILLSNIYDINMRKLVLVQKRFNTEIEKTISKYGNNTVGLTSRDEILDVSSDIVDYDTYVNKSIDFFRALFKDSKRIYYVIIILKSGKLKSFKVYENLNIRGFKYSRAYYSLDKDAVLHQKDKAFMMYLEEYSAPINFKSAKFVKDDLSTELEIELSSRNLVDVIDGKAFQGIINLGKGDGSGFQINWMVALAGLGVIVLGVLHATGQIDLMTMLAIK